MIDFKERLSKDNNNSIDRHSEEWFMNVYHLPAIEKSENPHLFMQPITNPIGNAWYNKAHKVGKGAGGGWLKNMVVLVELSLTIFTTQSGRATSVTQMVAKGVPDEEDMAITGHCSTGGYKRTYNQTQRLKMKAACSTV